MNLVLRRTIQQTWVLCAAILGASIVLAVAIYVFGRLRIAQHTTLQKLIDRGMSDEQLLRSAGLVEPRSRDLRRGLLLIGVGLAWSSITCFVGGKAWILGAFPVTIGLVYVLFRILDGRAR